MEHNASFQEKHWQQPDLIDKHRKTNGLDFCKWYRAFYITYSNEYALNYSSTTQQTMFQTLVFVLNAWYIHRSKWYALKPDVRVLASSYRDKHGNSWNEILELSICKEGMGFVCCCTYRNKAAQNAACPTSRTTTTNRTNKHALQCISSSRGFKGLNHVKMNRTEAEKLHD